MEKIPLQQPIEQIFHREVKGGQTGQLSKSRDSPRWW